MQIPRKTPETAGGARMMWAYLGGIMEYLCQHLETLELALQIRADARGGDKLDTTASPDVEMLLARNNADDPKGTAGDEGHREKSDHETPKAEDGHTTSPQTVGAVLGAACEKLRAGLESASCAAEEKATR